MDDDGRVRTAFSEEGAYDAYDYDVGYDIGIPRPLSRSCYGSRCAECLMYGCDCACHMGVHGWVTSRNGEG